MSKEQIIFNFPGESIISRLLGLSAGLIVVFLSISSILSWSSLGLFTGFVLLSILFFLVYYKLIIKVVFYENYIEVRYLSKKKKIEIKSITKVYKNQEGFIPTHVYVLKYNDQNKNKKITFYCDDNQFQKVVSPWLSSKGVVLR